MKVAESRKRKWDGNLADIDEDFVRFVDELCNQVFGEITSAMKKSGRTEDGNGDTMNITGSYRGGKRKQTRKRSSKKSKKSKKTKRMKKVKRTMKKNKGKKGKKASRKRR